MRSAGMLLSGTLSCGHSCEWCYHFLCGRDNLCGEVVVPHLCLLLGFEFVTYLYYLCYLKLSNVNIVILYCFLCYSLVFLVIACYCLRYPFVIVILMLFLMLSQVIFHVILFLVIP